MGLRSSDRKLSFDILSNINSFDKKDDDDGGGDSLPLFRSNSDPIPNQYDPGTQSSFPPKSRKKKRHKKRKHASSTFEMIPEDLASVSNSNDRSGSGIGFETRTDFDCRSCVSGGGGGNGGESVETVTVVAGCEGGYNCGELRQRNVNGSEEVVAEESSTEKQQWRSDHEPLPNGSSVVTKLESAESLDWKRLIAEGDDLEYTSAVEQSPLKYFMEAMYSGNSLRSTITIGDERERQRVYDTIFRLPWRCELLIDVGFFVCLDSFLSLLTIMPTRIVMALYRVLNKSSIGLLQLSCAIFLALLCWCVGSSFWSKQISA